MDTQPYEHIRYDVEDPCAVITLHRPERLNAWTAQMQREVRDALAAAEGDPRVVGIILTGAGRGFCAGADVSALKSLSEGGPMAKKAAVDGIPGDSSFPQVYRRTYSFLASIRKPLIAAINGPCVGMAIPLICFCDLRFASEDATIMTAFAQRGLVAEYGASWMLPRLIGLGNAFDVLYSGRKVGAQEALRMGLVNRVVAADALLPEAKAYVRELAQHCAPGSLAAIKRQVYLDLVRPLDEALQESVRLMVESFQGDDFKEGVSSLVEKRPAHYKRVP